jgi:DMSO reductase family type II enzyme heme b subunit
MWKADLQKESGGESAVEQMLARGHLINKDDEDATLTERMDRLLTPQPPESQNVWGQGVWEDGVWKVVMKRALDTGDDQDTQLVPGKLVPISFQAWDGSNGERGLMMSVSSWHFLMLDKSTPLKVYLYALFGILAALALEVWLVRRVKRGGRRGPESNTR